MISSILSILGGIGDFASYIANFFKEKGIRDNQENIDELKKMLEYSESNYITCKEECEKEKEAMRIKYEQEIQQHDAEIKARNPKIGGRIIEG